MASGNAPLSVTLSLVDQATAPMRAVASAIKKSMEPIHGLKNRLKMTSEDIGLPKVREAFGSVSKAYGGVAKEAKSLGKELAIVAGAATAAVSALAWRTSSVGDAVAKTSQKVGISAEAWSALAYAGDQSGVAASTLQGGLTRLNKNLSEAATGNKTASAMFDRLGISIYDANGNLKTADAAMSEVADKLNTVEDAAHRSRLAAEFFGRSAGPEMIPLLAEGSEGIENLKRRAAELGLVWNGVDSKNAEKFGDTMEDVKNALDGVVFTIGKQLLPILTKWGNDVIGLITKHRELIGVKVAEWLQRFNEYLPTLEGHIANLWSQVSGFALKVDSLVQSFGGWGAVMPYVAAGLAAIKLAPLALSVVTLTKSIAGLGWALGTMGYKFATLIKLPQLLIGGLKLFANMFLGIGGAVKAILVPLAQGIVGFGKGAVIVGKVLGGMLVKGLLAATVALKTFFVFMLTNPIGLIITAVTALAAAAYYIYDNWDWIGPWFKKLWNGIASWFSKFWADLSRVCSAVWASLASAVSRAWTNIADTVKSAWDGIAGWFSSLWASVSEMFSAIWEGIKTAVVAAWAGIVNIVTSIFGPIVGYFTERIDAVKSAFDVGFVEGIKAIFLNFSPARWVADAMDALTKYLFGFSLTDAGTNIINSLWDGLKFAWEGVAGWFKGIGESIAGLIPESVLDVLKTAQSIGDGVVNAASGVAGKVSGFAGGIWDSVSSAAGFIGGTIGLGESETAYGPPVGVHEMIRRDTVTRSETVRDAKVMVEFSNVPQGVAVNSAGVTQTRVTRAPMTGYNGLRMGM